VKPNGFEVDGLDSCSCDGDIKGKVVIISGGRVPHEYVVSFGCKSVVGERCKPQTVLSDGTGESGSCSYGSSSSTRRDHYKLTKLVSSMAYIG